MTWRGQAMGAVASLQVHHHDRAIAECLVERSLAEVRRLEAVFSLYRADSGADGAEPSGCPGRPTRGVGRSSGRMPPLLGADRGCLRSDGAGAVDALSGPLLHPTPIRRAHPQPALREALARVGFGRVTFDANRIALARRGMGLTLNGIAQGYVTDRVVGILRAGGIESSLVDMGEPRAMGSRPSGEPWRIGIADPHHPERVRETLNVLDQAVATSGAYGFRFDRQAASTTCSTRARAPRPTVPQRDDRDATARSTADALSTAFSLMPIEAIARTLRHLGKGQVRLSDGDGEGHRPHDVSPESHPTRRPTHDGSSIDNPNGRRSPSCPQPARRP